MAWLLVAITVALAGCSGAGADEISTAFSEGMEEVYAIELLPVDTATNDSLPEENTDVIINP